MIKENQKLLNLLKMLIDGIIIAFSFLLSYLLRFDEQWSPLFLYGILKPVIGYPRPLEDYLHMLIFLIPCYLIIYRYFGMYDPKRTSGGRAELFSLIKANLLGILYCFSVLYMIKQPHFARSFLLIFLCTNFAVDFTFRFSVIKVMRAMRHSGINLKHILLVGYSRTTEHYIDRLKDHTEWGYEIHGILDDSKEIGIEYRKIPVIGTIDMLKSLLSSNEYDEVAITLSIEEYAKLEDIVEICERSGIHTKFVPDYNNAIPNKPYTEDLDGVPVIHVRHVPLNDSVNKAFKRFFDIAGALFGLIILAVPMAIIALLIKKTSPGPLIFKQTRVGLHNREFQMYKFRSMRLQDADEEKEAWTTKDDPRVTPIGHFIRKTNIDELPQLVNVLKGDMSLVGPRPERPYFVDKYKKQIKLYMIKHQVRPGMTGWAQVNGYRGDTSIKKRIDYDLYYVENWTLLLDIKIIFLTFFGKKVKENAY